MARAEKLKDESGMLRAKLLSVKAVPPPPPPPPPVPRMSIDRAAAEGNLDVLRAWRDTSGPLKYSVNALDKASINGHIHVLKWWHSQRDSRLQLLKIYDLSDLDLVPRNPIVLARKNNARDAAEWWLEYPGVFVAENALHALSLLGDTAMVYDLVQKFGTDTFDMELVSHNLHQYDKETEDWWRDTDWL
ncbi:hypothetical protein H9P43_009058 [Blastocladiella emersonii ATCC 22665]|nr:hypothetical protein H9P43_009058 [Blastocladiella emersonii ATCC 22665]